jgi:hypothetical protein
MAKGEGVKTPGGVGMMRGCLKDVEQAARLLVRREVRTLGRRPIASLYRLDARLFEAKHPNIRSLAGGVFPIHCARGRGADQKWQEPWPIPHTTHLLKGKSSSV